MTTPKNAVVVLLDSLNRHLLGCYWPPYLIGTLPERQARQIRAQYGGKLTLIDLGGWWCRTAPRMQGPWAMAACCQRAARVHHGALAPVLRLR